MAVQKNDRCCQALTRSQTEKRLTYLSSRSRPDGLEYPPTLSSVTPTAGAASIRYKLVRDTSGGSRGRSIAITAMTTVAGVTTTRRSVSSAVPVVLAHPPEGASEAEGVGEVMD